MLTYDFYRAEGASESVIYKIDVPANRYDLLCVEGLTMGLQIFQEKFNAPLYRCITPDQLLELRVQPATADVRPFVVAAVLKDITLTPEIYHSFIDLQVRQWLFHIILKLIIIKTMLTSFF